MNKHLNALAVAALAGIGLAGTAAAQECVVTPGQCCAGRPDFSAQAYAGFSDFVSVVTASPAVVGSSVIKIFDLNGVASAPPNANFPTPSYSDPSWTGTNLGSVFGVTLDAAGNIYVTASTAYSFDTAGPGGWGAVYRIDAVSGAISTFATLPNTGPGLGNISYDCTFDQFFVTNHEDGVIYRLDSSGAIVSTFDPGAADAGTPGYAALGERLWGVEPHDGHLYYSKWNEDQGNQSSTVGNEVWSVALDGAGDFTGFEQLELIAPPITGNWSNPISDIRFTPRGTMLLGERSMNGETFPGAHRSRVLEYECVNMSWNPSANGYQVGVIPSITNGTSCAGGVDIDYGPDGTTFSTGDALQFTPDTVYGFQAFPAGGGDVTNSPLIDYNLNLTIQDKTAIGDIVVNSRGCSCQVIEITDVDCPTEAGGAFTVTADVTNQSGQVIENIFLTPLGTATANPNVIALGTPLADGDTTTITFDVNGASGGETVCFRATLLTDDFEECCSDDLCIDLPDCDCLQITDASIECLGDGTGDVLYNFTFQNLSGGVIEHVYLVPTGGVTMTPNYFDLTGAPVAPWGTASLNTVISGASAGDIVCFNMTIHDTPLDTCCADEICVEIPQCDVSVDPDRCRATAIVACCPDTRMGQAVLTICNGGSSPASFDWMIDNLAPSGSCTAMLDPTDFTPNAGTVGPIPAGGCVNIVVDINCDRLPGQDPIVCANYGVTFTNLNTGKETSCEGIVQNSRPGTVKPLDPDPTDLTSGASDRMDFEFALEAGEAGDIAYAIMHLPTDPTAQPSLSLNGLAPGEPVTGVASIPLGEKVLVSVDVTHEGAVSTAQFEEIYVIADVTGDGKASHAAASDGVQLLPAGASVPGDANGDGLVNFDDLNLVLADWGMTFDPFSPNDNGDVNNDGFVDFDDLNLVLANWGMGA